MLVCLCDMCNCPNKHFCKNTNGIKSAHSGSIPGNVVNIKREVGAEMKKQGSGETPENEFYINKAVNQELQEQRPGKAPENGFYIKREVDEEMQAQGPGKAPENGFYIKREVDEEMQAQDAKDNETEIPVLLKGNPTSSNTLKTNIDAAKVVNDDFVFKKPLPPKPKKKSSTVTSQRKNPRRIRAQRYKLSEEAKKSLKKDIFFINNFHISSCPAAYINAKGTQAHLFYKYVGKFDGHQYFEQVL